jgi:hypothetical protein
MREYLISFLIMVATVFSAWLAYDLGASPGVIIDVGAVVGSVLILWVLSWV